MQSRLSIEEQAMKPGVPLPRIQSASARPGLGIEVTLTDGRQIVVDLSGWVARGGEVYQRLTDEAVFGAVAVVDFGTALQWGDEEDDLTIDVAHLLLLEEAQRPMEADDVSRWQNAMRLSNNEAADFLGVARSTWMTYKKGRLPKSVQIALKAMLRDPVVFEANFRPRKIGRPRRGGDGAPPRRRASA